MQALDYLTRRLETEANISNIALELPLLRSSNKGRLVILEDCFLTLVRSFSL